MLDWTPAQLEEQLEAGTSVFLKLWKKGCGACRLSTPAIERIEAKAIAGLVFGQISTDDYPEMLEISDTEVLPVFFVFVDKKLKGKHIGFKGLEKLDAFVSESLGRTQA